jgi:hypothetical protein
VRCAAPPRRRADATSRAKCRRAAFARTRATLLHGESHQAEEGHKPPRHTYSVQNTITSYEVPAPAPATKPEKHTARCAPLRQKPPRFQAGRRWRQEMTNEQRLGGQPDERAAKSVA